MSGESTVLVWDERCVALWGTGVRRTFMSSADARRGAASDEAKLLTDWWSRRDAIAEALRAHARAVLPMTAKIAARIDPHAWRDRRRRRAGDASVIGFGLAKQTTRQVWIACVGKGADVAERDLRRIVSARAAAEPLCRSRWREGDRHVERPEIAVASRQHSRLLDTYSSDWSRVAVEALGRLPRDWFIDAPRTLPGEEDSPRVQHVRFGDPLLRLAAVFAVNPHHDLASVVDRVRAVLEGVTRAMPAALARVEAERPRRPPPVVVDEATLRVGVTTSLLMSAERAAEWEAGARRRAASVARRCGPLLAAAATTADMALAPFDPSAPLEGFALPDGNEWFRTTLCFTPAGVVDQARRTRMWEALIVTTPDARQY